MRTLLQNLGTIRYGKRQVCYSSNIANGSTFLNITVANPVDYSPAIILLWQDGKLSGNYLSRISKKLQKFIIENIPAH
jgi:hypothetical protein